MSKIKNNKEQSISMNIHKYLLVSTIIFLGIFGTTQISQAATYYIDYAGGSDSNNGISTSTPWKHSPGDSNATGNPASTALVAGDTVVFKKGVTYLGRITSVANSGSLLKTGANASITSDGVLTSSGANFQTAGVQAGDEIYIYHSKASMTNTWVESCGLWLITSVDSQTQLTLAGFDGVAHSTAEMTYRIIRPITFKSLSSWGNGDATISGENTRADAFNLNRSRIRIEGLKIYNTNNYGIFLSVGTDLHIIDCKFDTINAGQATGVGTPIASSGVGDYFVVSGCVMTNVSYCLYLGEGSYSLFEKNNVTGGSTRSIYGTRKYQIIRHNYLKDFVTNSYGHADGIGPIDESPWNDVQWIWIYGNYIENVTEFIALYGSNGIPNHIMIHGNVFKGRYDQTGQGDAAILLKQLGSVYIFNNTFYASSGLPFRCAMRIEESPGTKDVRFINNVYYANTNSGEGGPINLPSNSTSGQTFKNNHYYHLNSAPFAYSGSYNTYAQWKTHLNADSTNFETGSYANITTNPNFVDIANNDVHLQSTSPCKDAGMDLSAYFTLDKDKKVRGQGSGWDIGAYEYVSGSTQPAYTLTVAKSGTGLGTVTGTGINCGSDCAETINTGTSVTLTASADSDSIFSGWSGGGCSGTGACTVTMNLDITVTASFNQPGSPVNLLTNSDFESGFTSGLANNWQMVTDGSISYSVSQDTGHQGSGQKITVTTPGSWGLFFYQTPAFQLNQSYTWSFWYKTQGGNLWAEITNPQANQVVFEKQLPDTSGIWQYATYTFQYTNSQANQLRFYSNTAGTYWLDDIQLVVGADDSIPPAAPTGLSVQ